MTLKNLAPRKIAPELKSKLITRGLTTITVIVLIKLLLFVSVVPVTSVSAQNFRIIPRSELNLDLSQVEDPERFGRPSSVLIAPIRLRADVQVSSGKDWYRGLFYYLASGRFGFTDIPAHYVVDSLGQIYEGSVGGPEQQLEINTELDSPIVVAYLDETGGNDFTLAGREAIQNLSLQLANQNSIPGEDFALGELVLEISRGQQTAELVSQQVLGSWQFSFTEIQERVSANYDPQPQNYRVAVEGVESPASSMRPDTTADVKLTLRNDSSASIYADDDTELLLSTSSGGASSFFLNEFWVSQSQLRILPEGAILRPGQSQEFTVKIQTPFDFGRISESFVIKNGFGQTVSDREVGISVEVERGNLNIIEIENTETGTLNIRSTPGSGGSIVGKASPGQRYIYYEQQSGWYRIEFEGESGWVLGRYVRVI